MGKGKVQLWRATGSMSYGDLLPPGRVRKGLFTPIWSQKEIPSWSKHSNADTLLKQASRQSAEGPSCEMRSHTEATIGRHNQSVRRAVDPSPREHFSTAETQRTLQKGERKIWRARWTGSWLWDCVSLRHQKQHPWLPECEVNNDTNGHINCVKKSAWDLISTPGTMGNWARLGSGKVALPREQYINCWSRD